MGNTCPGCAERPRTGNPRKNNPRKKRKESPLQSISPLKARKEPAWTDEKDGGAMARFHAVAEPPHGAGTKGRKAKIVNATVHAISGPGKEQRHDAEETRVLTRCPSGPQAVNQSRHACSGGYDALQPCRCRRMGTVQSATEHGGFGVLGQYDLRGWPFIFMPFI